MQRAKKSINKVQGIVIGTYQVRKAQSAQDWDQVAALRWARFGAGLDEFDAGAAQIMVLHGGQLRAAFRLTHFAAGADMAAGYAGQYYDLVGFSALDRPVLELGRFCLSHQAMGQEADVLRLCFAAMALQVDRVGAALLYGCASFAGSDAAPHLPALAALKGQHSPHWRVGRKSGANAGPVIDLSALPDPPELRAALRALPPLLRSYLGIGGWVGEHAVQDFELGTIHIFTAVEVAMIPPARAAALRALYKAIDFT